MAEQLKIEAIDELPVKEPAKKRTRKVASPKVEKETTTETKTTESKTAETKPAVKRTTKKATKASKVQEFLGTGKRKSSVARVRISVGSGVYSVNNRDLKDYFALDTLIYIAKQPLVLVGLENTIDVKVNVYGGGVAGQAGAVRHGLTRALLEYNPELRKALKDAGFITRDARKKERKKYGLKKARKAPQFSKR